MRLPRIVDARAWIARRIAGYVRSNGGVIRDGTDERGYVVTMDAAHYAAYSALTSSPIGIDPEGIANDLRLLKEEYAIYKFEQAGGYPTDPEDHALRGRVIAVLELMQALAQRATSEELL